MIKKIVLFIYIILALSAIIFGIIYLLHHGIMPYHLAFFETSIEELNRFNPRIIELAVALMRVCGGACFSIGVGALLTIYYVRKDFSIRWSWLLFIQFLIILGSLAAVTIFVAGKIPEGGAKPPYILTLVLIGLDLIALILSFFIPRKGK